MKINKQNYSLALIFNTDGKYTGSFNVVYKDKIFSKETEIYDASYITEDEKGYALSDTHKATLKQIGNLIKKEFSKKGYSVSNIHLEYSSENGDLNIEFVSGGNTNNVNFSLLENKQVCKKALSFSRSLSSYMLKKLK
jgi:hypothetical protein